MPTLQELWGALHQGMSLIVRVVSLKDKPALTLLSQNSPADLTLGSQLEIEWEVSFLVTISFGDITDKKQLTLFCFALFFFFSVMHCPYCLFLKN